MEAAKRFIVRHIETEIDAAVEGLGDIITAAMFGGQFYALYWLSRIAWGCHGVARLGEDVAS